LIYKPKCYFMKVLLTLVLMILFGSMYAQSNSDYKEILSISIELPDLQSYLITENGQGMSQLKIKGLDFSKFDDSSLSWFGKPIQLVDKAELKGTQNKAHIDFYLFDVKQKTARVDFTYHSDQNNPVFWCYIEYEKTDNTWEITNLKTKEN